MTPAGEPFAAAIDGHDGKTWHLPLAPLTASSTPEAYSPGEQPAADRLAAAARLVSTARVLNVLVADLCAAVKLRSYRGLGCIFGP